MPEEERPTITLGEIADRLPNICAPWPAGYGVWCVVCGVYFRDRAAAQAHACPVRIAEAGDVRDR